MANIPPKIVSNTVQTTEHIATELPSPKPNPQKLPRLRNKRTFIAPIMIALVLLIGAAGGGYAVLQSKYGEADSNGGNNTEEQGEVLGDSFAPRGEPGAVIPLQFDQSELQVVANMLPVLISENRHEPTAEERRNQERTEKLVDFLTKHKSPLAKDEEAIKQLLVAKNMKMVLSISFVESNFCKRQMYYNCSGIGGASNFRKYENFGGWVKDMDSLLERRYKNLPVEDFIGVYVQPGSQSWVNGVKQILAELKQRGVE